MSQPAPSEYLATAAIWAIKDKPARSAVPQDRDALNDLFVGQYGMGLKDDQMNWLLARLEGWGIVKTLDDRYAGEILAFSELGGSLDALRKHSKIADDTHHIGNQWLRNVLAKEEFWRDLEREFEADGASIQISSDNVSEPVVPASDRLVTLDHNQIRQVSKQTSELIDALELDNGDPTHPGLRERLLGQIRAGRELIQAGQFKAYLLYEVLVKALNEIIEKYGNETIKALANALLGAVVSKVLEG